MTKNVIYMQLLALLLSDVKKKDKKKRVLVNLKLNDDVTAKIAKSSYVWL